MDNNREEFFHVILGPNSHFEYEYNDVKEIFARVDTFDYPGDHFILDGKVKAFITKDNKLEFPGNGDSEFYLRSDEGNINNVHSMLSHGVENEHGLIDYLKDTYIDEDSVHKMHRIYMAYDYFRADSESAMDFHNKYPDYEKFTPLPDNELVEEVNDLERLKISSGVDKQNVVERYQLNKVNDMLGVYHPISELIDISESEVITTDNVDEFMKELDLLVDPGLCR